MSFCLHHIKCALFASLSWLLSFVCFFFISLFFCRCLKVSEPRNNWQLHIIFYSFVVRLLFASFNNKQSLFITYNLYIHFHRSSSFFVFIIEERNNGIMLEFVAHHKITSTDKTNTTRLIYENKAKRLIMLIYRFDIFFFLLSSSSSSSLFFLFFVILSFSFSMKSTRYRGAAYIHIIIIIVIIHISKIYSVLNWNTLNKWRRQCELFVCCVRFPFVQPKLQLWFMSCWFFHNEHFFAFASFTKLIIFPNGSRIVFFFSFFENVWRDSCCVLYVVVTSWFWRSMSSSSFIKNVYFSIRWSL